MIEPLPQAARLAFSDRLTFRPEHEAMIGKLMAARVPKQHAVKLRDTRNYETPEVLLLRFLRTCGDAVWTAAELAKVTDMSQKTCSTRFTHLQAKGWVFSPYRYHYQITDAGRAAIRAKEADQ